jgi:hypothetical protein
MINQETDLRIVYFKPDGLEPQINFLREKRSKERKDIIDNCSDCDLVKRDIIREHINISSEIGYQIIALEGRFYKGQITLDELNMKCSCIKKGRDNLYWCKPITARCWVHEGW